MTITVFENCNLLDGVTADIRDGMHVVVEGRPHPRGIRQAREAQGAHTSSTAAAAR